MNNNTNNTNKTNKTRKNKNKNKKNKTANNKGTNDACFFEYPDKYGKCIEPHASRNGLTLKLGSIVVRNDKGGAKEPSNEVPAFFGDTASTKIYGAAHNNPTSYYKVTKQPRLFILDAFPLIALAKGQFGPITKEEELTVVAYLDPPVNEKTVYPPEFSEDDDAVIQPMGFVTRKNLEEFKAKGQGLYINRKLANLVCRLGFDGWVALPGALYQWVPSRNAVIPYAPEIMLCKWDTFMERVDEKNDKSS